MQGSDNEAFVNALPLSSNAACICQKRQPPVSLSLSNFGFQLKLVLDIKQISNTEAMCKIFLGGPDEFAVFGLNKPDQVQTLQC